MLTSLEDKAASILKSDASQRLFSTRLQRKHHLGTCQKCMFSGFTSLNQNFWWGSAVHVFKVFQVILMTSKVGEELLQIPPLVQVSWGDKKKLFYVLPVFPQSAICFHLEFSAFLWPGELNTCYVLSHRCSSCIGSLYFWGKGSRPPQRKGYRRRWTSEVPFAPLTSGHRYCPFVPALDRNCAEIFQVKKTVDCIDSEGAFLNCRSGVIVSVMSILQDYYGNQMR